MSIGWRGSAAAILGIGLLGGLLSGLLGVGGGTVLVPLLVLAGLSQHKAHATSLAAIVPLAAVGAFTFALEDAIDYPVGLLLATGALAGAPLGARVMAAMKEGPLKILFGAFLVVVALRLVFS